MRLVFGSGNQHKVAEVAEILGQSLPELEIVGFTGEEPVEDGVNFLENAMIKARNAFKLTSTPSFADDSGLCIEVMGGAPGIFSARWSGQKSDAVNRDLILAQMQDVKSEHRAASFVATIALVDKTGEYSFTGIWSGNVAREATGNSGFGYDPIFIPEGFQVSAAELQPEVKNSISHRAMALTQFSSFLKTRPQ